jgi:2-C-methyl-D-erythritol 2,4-cyclodiphosphate synthase
MRVGMGYDAHRLVRGRKLIIGGVEIPSTKGLLGHSDADVLVHAIMDALLGACALGDIGTHFPNTEKKYKDISSLKLLSYVAVLLRTRKFKVINVDAAVVLEKPKLKDHFPAMQARLATALKITKDQISLKATTNEGMGCIGRGEGAAAWVVALVQQRGRSRT